MPDRESMAKELQRIEARPNFDPLDEKMLADSLASENQDLLERVASLLAAAPEWEAIAVIDTTEDAQDLTDFISQLKTAYDVGEDRRAKRKLIYTGPANVVQSFFKTRALDPLEAVRTTLKKKLEPYLLRVKDAQRAVAAKALADALGAMQNATSPEQIRDAATALKKAQAAAKGAGIKTDFGSKAHLTERWAFEVEDITKVPAAFLQVNEAAVRAVLQTGTPEKPAVIPGIKVLRAASVSA